MLPEPGDLVRVVIPGDPYDGTIGVVVRYDDMHGWFEVIDEPGTVHPGLGETGLYYLSELCVIIKRWSLFVA